MEIMALRCLQPREPTPDPEKEKAKPQDKKKNNKRKQDKRKRKRERLTKKRPDKRPNYLYRRKRMIATIVIE